MIGGRAGGAARALLLLAFWLVVPAHAADVTGTVARVKRSIVAVGTVERGRTPLFQFRGSGFAVAAGNTIVTNAHVLPAAVDAGRNEVLAILLPGPGNPEVREARRLAVDPATDLALLAIDGKPLPPLRIGDSDSVREGQEILMTGYPIGSVLGPYPATHHGMIAALTPIVIPQGRASDLNRAQIRRIESGPLTVFQLDATAYPGNSGSPIYDPMTGDVLGVVNMVFVKGTKEAALTRPSGITYAIPANHVTAILRNFAAERGQKPERR